MIRSMPTRAHDVAHVIAVLICIFFSTPARPQQSVEVAGPMGVTFDKGTTTFRVWAPHASSVAVIGDFNGWKAMQGDQLSREGESGVWSASFRRSLPKGAYQFLINGSLARRDPYNRAVTADGKKSLFYDPTAFDWKQTSRPAQELDNTVIYELHVGAFYDPKPTDGMPGTFDDAARKLDYLVELGVTTLCILPVNEFSGNHSWGYNPSDPFAVEQAYGGPDGLKAFVAMCHSKGLAVHLDIVHNHYGPQNLDLIRFDGTGGDTAGGIYFYDGDGISMTPWGPRPRFSDPMVRRYIQDNVEMWMREYQVDGFRWDSTINIRAYDLGARPLPEGARMLDDINTVIHSRYPGRVSIAEDSLNIGNFDGSWDYDFHHMVMPQLSARYDDGRDVGRIADAMTRRASMWRVVYVDNHDEAGKINQMQRIASDIDPADPGSERARTLSSIGALLTLTAPGIPLLFMGNEFQESGTFHDDIPLDWGKTRKNEGLLSLHRDLIALRKNTGKATPGLKGLEVRTALVSREKNQLVYWRWAKQNDADKVVVAVNVSGEQAEVTVPFPRDGRWACRVNTDWLRYGGADRQQDTKPLVLDEAEPRVKIVMAPYSAHIYSLVDRPAPGPSARAAQSAKTAAKEAVKPPVSMYASVNLSGNFNGWDATSCPLTLTADSIWEGRFSFTNATSPSFKLTANKDGVIYWGGHEGKLTVRENDSVLAKRLGKSFTGEGTWSGVYMFRFNEELLTLDIEQLAPAPVTQAAPIADDGDYRTWTDTRGARIDAKLVEANPAMVTLEDRKGRTLQLPINRFSDEDQAYVREWQNNQN